MSLFNHLKNLFTPKDEARPRRKVAKKVKKRALAKKSKKKPPSKLRKKPVGKRPPKKLKQKSAKPLRRPLEEEEIGMITHYFGKISVGIIKLKSTLEIGEKIHIKGAHDDFTQTVNSIQINHKDVSTAGKGTEIGIKVSRPVHENDRVYRI